MINLHTKNGITNQDQKKKRAEQMRKEIIVQGLETKEVRAKTKILNTVDQTKKADTEKKDHRRITGIIDHQISYHIDHIDHIKVNQADILKGPGEMKIMAKEEVMKGAKETGTT